MAVKDFGSGNTEISWAELLPFPSFVNRSTHNFHNFKDCGIFYHSEETGLRYLS
jgi:hypothetical protein